MPKTRLSSARIPTSLSIGSGAIVFAPGTVHGPLLAGAVLSPDATGALRSSNPSGTIKG